MKMRRVFLFTFCLVIFIVTARCTESTSEQNSELVDPVDEVTDEADDEDLSPRPIRASAANAGIPRKRRRGRKNGVGVHQRGVVQKRRLPATFRPTRAPLFEASPPDPYMEAGIVGGHYGHSHSPPTRDPYYSPSKYERERKRTRIKLASDPPLVPLPQNSFDDTGPAVLSSPAAHTGPAFGKQPGKNYAFAYAVGDDAEDFSHKEAKDGPITIGEYRITLPDGRTQVVRYTAGGKHGYKADVTYEHPDGNPNALPAAGPTPYQHPQQYHTPVTPSYHRLSANPSFNSNRIIKSRPLKTVALHSDEDVEYSPGTGPDEEQLPQPRPSPKIRLKAGGNILPSPTPTGEYLNGITGTTPTPRPNSIYDKISPFRGGKYSGSEELAYAHEHSPRAGPARSKKLKSVTSTAASFYNSPSPSPYPHKTNIVAAVPQKKYKNHGVLPYVAQQPQANHVTEYVRPQKHIQYLQETPVRHSTTLIAKPLKNHGQHVVPLDTYPTGPAKVSYSPQVHKIKKAKKSKQLQQHHHQHHHGIHNPLGQYLLQTPVTSPSPVTYSPSKEPFHYYNSFHPQHHHGYGQISASPSPVSSVTHSESPYPNAFPGTSYGTGPSGPTHTQSRVRLPSPPSTNGHVYLETPASGERPTILGVKEALSRLPSRELTSPKTTIHPYEVGAVDYGKGVAYGNAPQDKGYPDVGYRTGSHPDSKGYPDTGYRTFEGELNTDLDNLDPTNDIYNSVTSPGTTGIGFQAGHQDIGYYTNDVSDQFNLLDGLHNFDIEQANVREIRQPRPGRTNGRLYRRVNRRPDKRRGAPASAEPTKEEMEMSKTTSPTSSRPVRQRSRQPQQQQQQQQQVRKTMPYQRSVKPSQLPPPPPSTTARTPQRARRRRMRTTEPTAEAMTEQVTVESRRPRTRSRNNNSRNNNN